MRLDEGSLRDYAESIFLAGGYHKQLDPCLPYCLAAGCLWGCLGAHKKQLREVAGLVFVVALVTFAGQKPRKDPSQSCPVMVAAVNKNPLLPSFKVCSKKTLDLQFIQEVYNKNRVVVYRRRGC